jgi:single-strand DNA-binding protein
MAKTRNRVELIGHLVADPELHHTPAGYPCAWFTVETTEDWHDSDGRWQTAWEWHRIVAWGSLAQQCYEFLAWYSSVFVEGHLTTRTWATPDQLVLVTEIVLEDLIIFNSPPAAIRETHDPDILKDYWLYGHDQMPWYRPPQEPAPVTVHRLSAT